MFRANPERFEPSGEIPLEAEGPTGEPKRLLRHPAWAAPILAHGLLYVRGPERLVCLELERADGRP